MRHTLLRLLKRAAQTHIIAHVISSSSREEEEAPERAALDILYYTMCACGTRPRGCVITRRTLLITQAKAFRRSSQSSKTTYVVSTAANI